MKKLLTILMATVVISGSLTNVVACKKGINLTNNTPDSVRMLSITSLNTNMLVRNRVKIGANISQSDLKDLIKLLGLETSMNQSINGPSLGLSFRVVLLANQLLGNISASVPNYQWINSKLQWQSSRWGFNQFLRLSAERGIASNASAWLPTNDDFSLSVTFLDSEKAGWKGAGNPKYARVNINKRIVVDDKGIVDVPKSNADAVWVLPNADPAKLNAAITVEHSTNPQTQNRGHIYQGFVNSSELIDLQDIFDDSITTVPSSVFGYTPSVVDLVNNMFINSNIVNKVLADNQAEIEDALNDYLTNEPIWLGSKVILEDVKTRLRNQIFLMMFNGMLNRYDNKYDYSDSDLEYANQIMITIWEKVRSAVYRIKELEHLEDVAKQRVLVFYESLSDSQEKDRNGELTSSEISAIINELRYAIKISRENGTFGSTEDDIAAMSELKTNFYYSDMDGRNHEIKSMANLSNFGANPSQLLNIGYFYQSLDPLEDNVDKLTYSPDKGKDQWSTDQEFISDDGFLNAFYNDRFNKIYPEIAKESGWGQGGNDKTVQSEPFDLSKLGDDTDYSDEDWFAGAGYLDQFKVNDNNKDEISIAMMARLISDGATRQLQDAFAIGFAGGISFDNYYQGNFSYSFEDNRKDDDEAFLTLITSENFVQLIDLAKNTGKSNLRDTIYDSGLEFGSAEITLYINNSFDSYGNIRLQDKPSLTWWSLQDSSIENHSFNVILNIDNDKGSKGALINYWKSWVMNNPDNLDHKIPPLENPSG
ncbi:hypothetical protein SCLARK_00846 [Spiroplasma clarkii]|uniref:Uncharacterized protein n=1 Tax=Spiroplasma clarkii TaxID=2139 RepID=A0A1Y0L0F7_9MOLU|nr:hypothetical protein [Spiroplasma clarkii]ARU91461.1 hypothetical protein SCLARK_00846 [Spiroplasma clarkii]ATX70884.1 hypothetical protein SCLAR_v1c05650 [Spiroplasma clarkii]